MRGAPKPLSALPPAAPSVRRMRAHRAPRRSGSPHDAACAPEHAVLAPGARHYLVVDTNLVLHQLDFLEHAAVTDVVVLSTVYAEVQARNTAAFLRLKELLRRDGKRFYFFSNEHHRVRTASWPPEESFLSDVASYQKSKGFQALMMFRPLQVTGAVWGGTDGQPSAGPAVCLTPFAFYIRSGRRSVALQDTYVAQNPGETINDRNDRAIRAATSWYEGRAGSTPVILLSEDAGNVAKARDAGLQAMPLSEYVEKHAGDKTVGDVVAWYGLARRAVRVNACLWRSALVLGSPGRPLPAARSSPAVAGRSPAARA